MRRKLTTIVAADVVGYSRLLGEDESGTLDALEILRTRFIAPKAVAYAGRIVRFLGDGAMLEFESALGAVEFAIELQRSLAEYNAVNPHGVPMLLRIGINLGDVVFEGDDIHGDGVNIAVRIEALAEPGGLCLTESVHAQIKNRISAHFVTMGQRQLKNIADAVEVWRWRAPADSPDAADADKREEGRLNGRHIIDPKVVDVLLNLHARSVLLAISNALDAIVDETDDTARVEQLYFHVSEELHKARALLNGVKIERVDHFRNLSAGGSKYQTLGEFVASMFSDSKAGFAFKILPEAHHILESEQSFIVKRKLLMDLVRRFHDENHVTKSRSLIKFAYVD